MLKNRFNISLILLLMVLGSVAQVRQERDYKRAFKIEDSGTVEIISKYGEVIVRTWEYDSVMFDVVVKAEGKNSEVVRKSMNRVDVRFKQVGKIIAATTEISNSGGVFGGLSNQIGSAIGGNKLKVDFQVWIPANVLLSIDNKYGNVYLADLDNEVNLTISHGDIKAGDLSNDLNLKHSFGKASFRSLNNGIFTLRGADLQIDQAQVLDFESGSSEIRIDQAEEVSFNSRNDKIRLMEVSNVSCEGSFTDLSVDYLKVRANLDFSYGDIYLSRIQRDFKALEITGKSTDINLILDQASYIRTSIKGPEEKMILPNSMLTMSKEYFENENLISLKGDVGPPNATSSDLNIIANAGALVISIKETPLFSERD